MKDITIEDILKSPNKDRAPREELDINKINKLAGYINAPEINISREVPFNTREFGKELSRLKCIYMMRYKDRIDYEKYRGTLVYYLDNSPCCIEERYSHSRYKFFKDSIEELRQYFLRLKSLVKLRDDYIEYIDLEEKRPKFYKLSYGVCSEYVIYKGIRVKLVPSKSNLFDKTEIFLNETIIKVPTDQLDIEYFN